MDTSKLKPRDSRVQTLTTTIRGKTVQYILGEAYGTKKATMVLIHGWPDLSFGWRYQIPYFMSLGFQVVVPDMVGYGGTDAPQDLKEYTLKSVAEDIKELATKFVGVDGQIVLGGHDWGGFVVWRTTEWFPKLIQAVFSICTPYAPPSPTYIPLEAMIDAGKLTSFTYQLQLKGPDVEAHVQGKERVRQFLNAMYGGKDENGKTGFSVTKGLNLDRLSNCGPNPFVSKDELEYYVEQYMLQDAPQLRGPLNWYRTRPLNGEDDTILAERGGKIVPPALFITATEDDALPPWMSHGMESHFDDLTRGEVEASHWALWQASESVNAQITRWLGGVLGGAVKSSL